MAAETGSKRESLARIADNTGRIAESLNDLLEYFDLMDTGGLFDRLRPIQDVDLPDDDVEDDEVDEHALDFEVEGEPGAADMALPDYGKAAMRIYDEMVIQAVGDDRIVFVYLQTGVEVVKPVAEIPALFTRLDHDYATGKDLAVLSPELEIPRAHYVMVGFALGYFWGALPGGRQT